MDYQKIFNEPKEFKSRNEALEDQKQDQKEGKEQMKNKKQCK